MKTLLKIIPLAMLLLALSANIYAYNNALRFKITGNGYSDETVIRLLNGATENFDGAYDAWKLFTSNTNAPSIYTQVSPGQELSINALPEYSYDKSLTIFTNIPAAGNYTLEIEEIFSMSSNYKISLTDIATGNHYYLTGDTLLNFTINSQQNAPTFTFNISTPISISAYPESCQGSNDGGVSIENKGNTNWIYEIVDANGNLINNNNSTAITANQGNLAPGTYTARVISLGITDEAVFSVNAAPMIIADFELDNDTIYLSNGAKVDITNFSQNAHNYSWDFGDGSSMTNVNPSYTYSLIGDYTITLDAYRNNCVEQTSKTITVLSSPNLSTAIEDQVSHTVKIKKLNNGDYQLNVPVSGEKRLLVYNLSGKIMLSNNFIASDYNFSLNTFPGGMYIVKVTGENNFAVSQKIIR